ncbi:Metallo-dependent phosphatase [Microthyrium microscopicum]|uniref:Metallo-dependent phosphatase n=1 Tax=Microthyrium microscopicum TaxID=703497 RepID=A0A6A6UJ86_9PEZI|nr:Metallo-dependent phosphatase [Microthyrium microscopicum]
MRSSRRISSSLARKLLLALLAAVSVLFICFVMRQELLWSLTTIGHVVGLAVNQTGYGPSLNFRHDGSFQITVFNDLHYGEGEDNPPEWGWGPISDVKTTQVMNNVLDYESQDLVVLNGDLITGENTHFENSTKYLDIIVAPLVDRGLTWASTYGNHDRAYNLSQTKLYKAEKKYSGSLTQRMVRNPKAGITNYVLEVYSRGELAMLLWFFDSYGGREYQKLAKNGSDIGLTQFVHPDVANWLSHTSSKYKRRYKRAIPSLGFVHIPTYATAAFQKTGVDPHKEPGINDDDPLAPQSIFWDQYTGEDVPFMKALLQTEGLMAVFSGHDHGDDWCHRWDRKYPDMDLKGNGIFLCFGRHTGYGGYGKWTRGSRQIRVNTESLGKEVETWVRLEDGSVSGRVVLNATYTKDYYPAVKNRTSS